LHHGDVPAFVLTRTWWVLSGNAMELCPSDVAGPHKQVADVGVD